MSIPVVIAQFALFIWLHGAQNLQPTWNSSLLIVVVILGIVIHELIHGISWVIFGNKPFSSIKFGFQRKTLTPYAHLQEPVEINAYGISTFLPGFILGMVPYLLSLLLADGNLFWFSLFLTSAAGATG